MPSTPERIGRECEERGCRSRVYGEHGNLELPHQLYKGFPFLRHDINIIPSALRVHRDINVMFIPGQHGQVSLFREKREKDFLYSLSKLPTSKLKSNHSNTVPRINTSPISHRCSQLEQNHDSIKKLQLHNSPRNRRRRRHRQSPRSATNPRPQNRPPSRAHGIKVARSSARNRRSRLLRAGHGQRIGDPSLRGARGQGASRRRLRDQQRRQACSGPWTSRTTTLVSS